MECAGWCSGNNGVLGTSVFAKKLINDGDRRGLRFKKKAKDVSGGGVNDKEVGFVAIVRELCGESGGGGMLNDIREVAGSSDKTQIHVIGSAWKKIIAV